MSNIIEGITKDLKAIPKNMKAKAGGMDTKKLVLLNLPYIFAGYFCDKVAWLWRVSEGINASDKMMAVMNRFDKLFANPLPSFQPRDLLIGVAGVIALRLVVYYKAKNAKKFRQGVEYGSARWENTKNIEPYIDNINMNVHKNQKYAEVKRKFDLVEAKYMATFGEDSLERTNIWDPLDVESPVESSTASIREAVSQVEKAINTMTPIEQIPLEIWNQMIFSTLFCTKENREYVMINCDYKNAILKSTAIVLALRLTIKASHAALIQLMEDLMFGMMTMITDPRNWMIFLL